MKVTASVSKSRRRKVYRVKARRWLSSSITNIKTTILKRAERQYPVYGYDPTFWKQQDTNLYVWIVYADNNSD